MPKFETRYGGHVSIFVPWQPTPIEIMAGGTYETDDKREIDALRGSTEVMERAKGEPTAPMAKRVEAEKPAVPVDERKPETAEEKSWADEQDKAEKAEKAAAAPAKSRQ